MKPSLAPWFALLLLAFPVGSAWPASVESARERGRELAAAIRSQRPAESSTSAGTLRMRQPGGRRMAIPIEVQVVLETNQVWRTIYRASLPDGRNETLTVVNQVEAAPHFILHRALGDGNVAESRPTRPDEMFMAFAGTDFWFVDLGMVFLHWPDQRWLGQETRRTRKCDMLESHNPMPAPGAYRRVVTWIDQETGGIVRAEAFDGANRPLKTFSPGSFTRVGARYELRDMEIRNEQSDSRTILEFQIDDPAKLGANHLPGARP